MIRKFLRKSKHYLKRHAQTWRTKLYRALSLVRYLFIRKWRRAFYENYDDYRKKFIEYKKLNVRYDAFTVPLWNSFVATIEDFFAHGLPPGFLTHPTLKKTMFMDMGGAWQDGELSFLKDFF